MIDGKRFWLLLMTAKTYLIRCMPRHIRSGFLLNIPCGLQQSTEVGLFVTVLGGYAKREVPPKPMQYTFFRSLARVVVIPVLHEQTYGLQGTALFEMKLGRFRESSRALQQCRSGDVEAVVVHELERIVEGGEKSRCAAIGLL